MKRRIKIKRKDGIRQRYWLKIPRYAKVAARKGLELRRRLPPSKKFGITPKEAKQMGIDSGITRAHRIIRNDYMPIWEAQKVARFYGRFKNKTGPRAEGAHLIWGGRRFERKTASFIKKLKED